MGNVLPAILIVIVCFPFAFNAQSLKPLPTEFVDCVTNQRGVPWLQYPSAGRSSTTVVSAAGSEAAPPSVGASHRGAARATEGKPIGSSSAATTHSGLLMCLDRARA